MDYSESHDFCTRDGGSQCNCNMSRILNANAILTSRCDSYCLVCDEHLRGDDEMIKHLVDPGHKRALLANKYSLKYAQDRIREVAAGYYCEDCNILLKMPAKVNIHISGEGHLRKKRDHIKIRNSAHGVMVEEKILVQENAWHGINDTECAPCDTIIADASAHRDEIGHILNLISAEVTLDEDENLYRTVDVSNFHCLTCNVVEASKTMAAHFDSSIHKEQHEDCCNKCSAIREKEIEDLGPQYSTQLGDVTDEQRGSTNKHFKESDAAFQCLACDVYLNQNDMIAHFDDPEHKRLSLLYKANQTNASSKPKAETSETVNQNETMTNLSNIASSGNTNTEILEMTAEPVSVDNSKESSHPELPNELPGAIPVLNETVNEDKCNEGENSVMSVNNETMMPQVNETDSKTVELKTENLPLTQEDEAIIEPERESAKTTNESEPKVTETEIVETLLDKLISNKSEVLLDETAPKITESKQGPSKVDNAGEVNEIVSTFNAKGLEVETKREVNDAKVVRPKSKTNKIDDDICKALGAVDYVAPDAQGRQWCIVCDWAMDRASVKAHVDGKHHQIMVKMHKDRASKKMFPSEQVEKSQKEDVRLKTTKDSKKNTGDVKKNSVVDSALEFEKYVKLDIYSEHASCRVCSKTVAWDCDAIRSHIDEHVKKSLKTDAPEVKKISEVQKTVSTSSKSPTRKEARPKQDRARERVPSTTSDPDTDVEIENFAKQHKLHFATDSKFVFCRVCVARVSSTLKHMKEHVNSVDHKNKVAKAVKTVSDTISKKPSYEFINAIVTIEDTSKNFFKDIVVNEKYVINIFSFMFMTKRGANYQCNACEMTVLNSELDEHKKSPLHEQTMNDVPVVSSQDSEFIREIRPNLFHCGFCNHIESPWPGMESHLQSSAHREAKTSANWRLLEYSPVIMQHRDRRNMELRIFNAVQMSAMFGVH